MTSALVGYTGFVGSNLARQATFEALFNSKNIEDASGHSFDRLIFAGAQAKKWWANQNPAEDWAGIKRALDALANVEAERVTLISTIDVLSPDHPGADERFDCRSADLHAYGDHRLRLEEAFRERYPQALIVRLPGLFGPGLKKNVIYDLLNDNILDKINPASSFQYYDLTRLSEDIETAESAGLDLVHLFTEPVPTRDILESFFPGKHIGDDAAPEAHYDFRTRHGRVFGGDDRYIESRDDVLARIGAFIKHEQDRA